ncbi:MAG: prolipoprotein diacylglyceryl transferase [Chitinophagaceae bacterium]
MYPNLYFLVKDIFGIDIEILRLVNTFGLMVAIAFIVAIWSIRKELFFRKNLFSPTIVKEWEGKPASTKDLLVNALIGFILGFKIIGIFFIKTANSQEYILSSEGSWWGGLLCSGVFTYFIWKDKKKHALPKPIQKEISIYPHDRVGDILIIAVVFGFLGAKLFDNLENWDRFIKDPIGELFSFSGLTFYGGLIFAAIGLEYYRRKHKIAFFPLLDSLAIATMFSYGIGRLGCQISGDGDWGIAHTAPNPFSWLPNWFWAYQYPNNVLGIELPYPVYPTPLYEAIICIGLYFILRFIGRKTPIVGLVSGIYFMMNGMERFLIELIRVNNKYHIGNLSFTQAELIALCLFFLGVFITIKQIRMYKKEKILSQ